MKSHNSIESEWACEKDKEAHERQMGEERRLSFGFRDDRIGMHVDEKAMQEDVTRMQDDDLPQYELKYTKIPLESDYDDKDQRK